ncbi:hypothetical protein [Cupriavidus necator]|uniref:hypothetical protein n=1 Tax=Cupriavidus necator TaxID=106590 RepID=UPI0005B31FE6|nr:hypothetical protein [Cupriavidus necator]
MTAARNSQTVVEVISIPNPKGRVSQEIAEVLSISNPKGRISQIAIEVLSLAPAVSVAQQPVVMICT